MLEAPLFREERMPENLCCVHLTLSVNKPLPMRALRKTDYIALSDRNKDRYFLCNYSAVFLKQKRHQLFMNFLDFLYDSSPNQRDTRLAFVPKWVILVFHQA